jgi:uncharacterized membrane protein YcaP (DUF421 family)
MFHLDIAAWEIVVRAAIVYVAVLGGLRLAGKRELGQMTAFDLVVILLISNAVQNAMVGPDTSVTGGMVAAATLLVANFAVANLEGRVGWFRRAVEGSPTLIINNGEFVEAHLKRESVDREEVMMALREHGFADPPEVQTAVLEVDGTISVVPMTAPTVTTRRRFRHRRNP